MFNNPETKGVVARFGACVARFGAMELRVGDRSVHLSPSEWGLLWEIYSRRDSMCQKTDLNKRFAYASTGESRSLDTVLNTLRKKIGPYIETVHGVGYRWNASGTAVVKYRTTRCQKRSQRRVV